MQKIALYVPKVLVWLGVVFVSFYMALLLLVNPKGEVQVEFNTNGKIDIRNSSAIDLDDIVVTIYDESDNIIYDKCITSDNMLRAIERVDFYEEKDGTKITDIKLLNTELQHWRYWIDVNDVLECEGQYHMFVLIETGNKQVKIENGIIKDAVDIYYAVDSITKQY